eukprot:65695_1
MMAKRRGRARGRHRPRFIRHSEHHVTRDRFPHVDAMYGTNQAPQSPYDEIPLQPRYDMHSTTNVSTAFASRIAWWSSSIQTPGSWPDNLENLDSMTPKLDPVVEKILHQLSYPKKKNYAAKDFIWVNRDDAWVICIVMFVVDETQFIVRPFGKSQSDSFTINEDQIHDTAEALSLAELRRCITSIKTELQNIHRVQDDQQRDLFQGTLVKLSKIHKEDTFGEVMKRHDDGTFSVRIREECTWYKGPRIVNQIARDCITTVPESELKCQTLVYEARCGREKLSNSSDNEDEGAVYLILNELGDMYLQTFLENGVSNEQIALCLQESDLKEMKIKLGHRRYILKQIETFEARKFDMSKPPPSRPPPEKVPDRAPKLVIYDFDRTLTSTDVYYDAQASKHHSAEHMVNHMDENELMEVFGGRERVKRLNEHLLIVTSQGVKVAIVSFTSVSVITAALKRMQLYDAFFVNSVIIGGDSMEMEKVNGNKAKCIMYILADHQWDAKDTLFVDDDPTAIKEINKENLCKSILVNKRRGLTAEHMLRIENMIKTGLEVEEGFANCNNEYEGPNPTQ